MKRLRVAIDGPAGAGKSTVARKLADKLGITYVDTGAMYRAIAWMVLQKDLDPTDEEAIAALAESTSIVLQPPRLSVNGVWLSDELRTPDVSQYASLIARLPRVRSVLVKKQQEIASQQSVVMDGRDIGSVVLPHADVKVFLTASLEERANRRYRELKEKGVTVSFEELKQDLSRRDEQDQTRECSPLRKAEDAVLIDTTHKSIEEIVEKIYQLCRTKMGGEE